MCFTHIKTLLLNTTRIRSFMLTSLKRALNHWKWGEHWT
ncbi:hypothetical protein LOK49_LG11G00279 [Camellia lanceoleosa]|uniref:Uncharacterized protein n=1 Tax=Camellia lanceoleosa TaxID=1840588 RepID=A0ACC0G4D6_9ERIC|nr:hypothetical protein LOK49_LG11G00279 [Camellia lanceoleosa]